MIMTIFVFVCSPVLTGMNGLFVRCVLCRVGLFIWFDVEQVELFPSFACEYWCGGECFHADV